MGNHGYSDQIAQKAIYYDKELGAVVVNAEHDSVDLLLYKDSDIVPAVTYNSKTGVLKGIQLEGSFTGDILNIEHLYTSTATMGNIKVTSLSGIDDIYTINAGGGFACASLNTNKVTAATGNFTIASVNDIVGETLTCNGVVGNDTYKLELTPSEFTLSVSGDNNHLCGISPNALAVNKVLASKTSGTNASFTTLKVTNAGSFNFSTLTGLLLSSKEVNIYSTSTPYMSGITKDKVYSASGSFTTLDSGIVNATTVVSSKVSSTYAVVTNASCTDIEISNLINAKEVNIFSISTPNMSGITSSKVYSTKGSFANIDVGTVNSTTILSSKVSSTNASFSNLDVESISLATVISSKVSATYASFTYFDIGALASFTFSTAYGNTITTRATLMGVYNYSQVHPGSISCNAGTTGSSLNPTYLYTHDVQTQNLTLFTEATADMAGITPYKAFANKGSFTNVSATNIKGTTKVISSKGSFTNVSATNISGTIANNFPMCKVQKSSYTEVTHNTTQTIIFNDISFMRGNPAMYNTANGLFMAWEPGFFTYHFYAHCDAAIYSAGSRITVFLDIDVVEASNIILFDKYFHSQENTDQFIYGTARIEQYFVGYNLQLKIYWYSPSSLPLIITPYSVLSNSLYMIAEKTTNV